MIINILKIGILWNKSFIPIVLFYGYKFLKTDIHGNESSFFA